MAYTTSSPRCTPARHPRSVLWSVVLAAAVVIGQGYALVHATHHELSRQPGQPACLICAFAHTTALRPSVPGLPPAQAVPHERPVPARLQAENLQPVALPQGRAPPPRLA